MHNATMLPLAAEIILAIGKAYLRDVAPFVEANRFPPPGKRCCPARMGLGQVMRMGSQCGALTPAEVEAWAEAADRLAGGASATSMATLLPICHEVVDGLGRGYIRDENPRHEPGTQPIPGRFGLMVVADWAVSLGAVTHDQLRELNAGCDRG